MNSTPLIRLVPGGKVGDFYLPVAWDDTKLLAGYPGMELSLIHI